MEKKYDPRHVARVAAILAEQFRGARITSFLPILIFKMASEYLATTSATAFAAKALITMPAFGPCVDREVQ